MPSSSEGSRVCLPTSAAATWSTETPTRMSAPSVLSGCMPVRKQASERAWSPGPSPMASALCWARPVSTSRSSLNGSSGSSVGGSRKLGPVSSGVQSAMWTPLGT